MGLLKKIKRHFAMAGGDFASIFREVTIPPLPAAASRLVAEVNRPDPDPDRLVKVISAEPELSAQVLRTVNSSFYALRHRVKTVHHAVVLLGTDQVRSLALSYATMASVPRPAAKLFDHSAFWADSLSKALLAKALAANRDGDEADEAFTSMLLADVALPVLLGSWEEYYAPVVERWREGSERLSQVERGQFQWDHAQAGAWILQSWGFPEDTVCFAGAHNLSREKLSELEMEDTIALPMAVASLAPSGLKPDSGRIAALIDEARDGLYMGEDLLAGRISGVRSQLEEMLGLFGIQSGGTLEVLDEIVRVASVGETKEAS